MRHETRVNIAVGLLLVSACCSVFFHLRALIDEPVDDLQRSAFDIAAHVDRELQAEKLKVERLAEFLVTSGNMSDLYQMVKVLVLPRGENVIVADVNGLQLFNSEFGVDNTKPVVADLPHMSQARAQGVTVVSDVYRGAHSGEWRVGITTPLVKDGRTIGTLTETWSPQTFLSLVNKVSLYPGSRWSIADRSGTIASLLGNPEFVGRAMSRAVSGGTLVDGEPVWVRTALTREDVVRARATVAMSGWTVSVLMPERLLMGRVYMWLLFYGAMFSTVLAVLLVWGRFGLGLGVLGALGTVLQARPSKTTAVPGHAGPG